MVTKIVRIVFIVHSAGSIGRTVLVVTELDEACFKKISITFSAAPARLVQVYARRNVLITKSTRLTIKIAAIVISHWQRMDQKACISCTEMIMARLDAVSGSH